MRIVLLALLVTPLLAGCSEPAQTIPAAVREAECGDIAATTVERQAIIHVEFAKKWRTYGDARLDRLEVAAQREGDPFDERSPDEDGCVRFTMGEEGSYMFWAFGETDRADCFWSGYFSGKYGGEPVVGATVTVKRMCT